MIRRGAIRRRKRARYAHPSELWLAEHYALRILELEPCTREDLGRSFARHRSSMLVPLRTRVDALLDEAREDADEEASDDLPDRRTLRARRRHGVSSSSDQNDAIWDKALAERRAEVEAQLEAGTSGPLFDNIHMLVEVLDLEPIEEQTLVLVALVNNHPQLTHLASSAAEYASFEGLLESLLDLPLGEASKLLDDTALLVESGLIVSPRGLREMAPQLGARLQKGLLEPHADLTSLIGELLTPAPDSALRFHDFDYLGREGKLLRAFVEGSMASGVAGANIMIYGPPGTGKTELVRTLAADLGAQLFEVPVEPTDDRPSGGDQRFASLRLAQRLVGKLGRCAMLLDEAEDIFPTQPLFARQRGPLKGLMNRALETNPTLTFWTTNAQDQIDPAHLRRFDLVLRLDVPPRATRRRIVDARLGEHALSEATLDALSRERLTPAEIDRLARVLSSSESVDSEEALASALRLGVQPVRALRQRGGAPPYDASLCTTQHDLEELAQGLTESGSGRLLLHGVPGTGKTAWVRHLAERLDKPLVEASASSLLSMWVGGTEKNLARVFERATTEEAVLFIDEADSFLRNRERAVQTFEVSATNELLEQMERFDGVFICATNLLDSLDPASLRRFDLKLEFTPLRLEARRRLFHSMMEQLGGSTEDADALRDLDRLDGLTPGDFAAVARRRRFLPGTLEAAWLVTALSEELDLRQRQGHQRLVGFG